MKFCVGLFLIIFSSILETNLASSRINQQFIFDDTTSRIIPVFANLLNDASCNVMGIENEVDKTCAFETELNLTSLDKCDNQKCVINFQQNTCPDSCNQLHCRHSLGIVPNAPNTCSQDGIYYNLDESFNLIGSPPNCHRITKLDFDESGGCTTRSKCFYNLLTNLPTPDGCTDGSCSDFYSIYLGDANQCQNGNTYFHFGKYKCKTENCDSGMCEYSLTVDLTENEMCLEGKCLFNFGSIQCQENLNKCFTRNKKVLDLTAGPNCYFHFGEKMDLSETNCQNGNCSFIIKIAFESESCLNNNCYFNLGNSNICNEDGCNTDNINYQINLDFGNECQNGSFEFVDSLGLYVFVADSNEWTSECTFTLST